MKFYILGLLSTSQAVSLQYADSEGPTKVDNGEDDEQVLATRRANGEAKWSNPLEWLDTGNDDDKVLLQSDGSKIVIKRQPVMK